MRREGSGGLGGRVGRELRVHVRQAQSGEREKRGIEGYAVARNELLELSVVAVAIALDPVAVLRIARTGLDLPTPQKDAVTKQDGDQAVAGGVSVPVGIGMDR